MQSGDSSSALRAGSTKNKSQIKGGIGANIRYAFPEDSVKRVMED